LSFGGLVFALQGFSVLGVELRANPETLVINPDTPENPDIPGFCRIVDVGLSQIKLEGSVSQLNEIL